MAGEPWTQSLCWWNKPSKFDIYKILLQQVYLDKSEIIHLSIDILRWLMTLRVGDKIKGARAKGTITCLLIYRAFEQDHAPMQADPKHGFFNTKYSVSDFRRLKHQCESNVTGKMTNCGFRSAEPRPNLYECPPLFVKDYRLLGKIRHRHYVIDWSVFEMEYV